MRWQDFVRELFVRFPQGLHRSEVQAGVAAELRRRDESRGASFKQDLEYRAKADRPTSRALRALELKGDLGRDGDRYYLRMQFWNPYYQRVLEDVLRVAEGQGHSSRSTTVPNEVLEASNHAQVRYMMILADGRAERKIDRRTENSVRRLRKKVTEFLDRHPEHWEEVLKSILPEAVARQDSDFFLIAQSDRSAMRRAWPCPDWKKGWPVFTSYSRRDRGKRLEGKLKTLYRRMREAGFPADIARRMVRDDRWLSRLSRSPMAFNKWMAGIPVPEAGPLRPPRKPPSLDSQKSPSRAPSSS